MTTTAGPLPTPPPHDALGVVRVVRAEKGMLLVVPEARLHDDPPAEPVRVRLDRDGLVAAAAVDAEGTDRPRAVPTVGDRLLLEPAGGDLRAAELLPRRSVLVRDSAGGTSLTQALAANVDVVLVVEHLDPDPDLGRVERLLTLAWRSGATPVVVLTKADLVPDPEGMADEVRAVALGVDLHVTSVVTGTGVDGVRALLAPERTLVVVGPSGAGKSTFVNELAGREVMATGGRRADGRGRHTTTHRELVALPGGALLVDTPGLRGVGLVADEEALDSTFADVAALAARCRFADCAHRTEPGCAVRAALECGDLTQRRFDSWRRLQREAAHQAARLDARLAAQERAAAKRLTSFQRHVRETGRQRP